MAERPSTIPVSRSLSPLRDVVASLSQAASGDLPTGSARQRLVRRVRAAGLSALPCLVRALCSPCAAEGEWAGYLLTRLAGPRVVERLTRLLEDSRTPADRRPLIARLIADLSIPARKGLDSGDRPIPLPDFIRSVGRDTDGGTLRRLVIGNPSSACDRRTRIRSEAPRRAPRPTQPLSAARRALAVREGLALLKIGEHEGARLLLEFAVAAAPRDPEGLTYLGNCLLHLGEPEAALARFEIAATVEPDEALHQWNVAAAAKAAGRMCRACRALDRYLALTDGADGAGQRRREAKSFVREYRKLFRTLYPGVPMTLLVDGENRFEQACEDLEAHRFDHAAEGFRLVLSLMPEHYPSWGNLGAAELARGNLDEADRCLRRALALKPDYGPAQENLQLLDARN